MDLHRSIARAHELGVDHISAYTLTIEQGTPLARKTEAGTFDPMEDDEQADLIEAVTDRLESYRYFRYEVSSYSPPGLEAVHNSIYWIGGAYLGVGAGAHSYLPAPDRSSAIRREGLRAPGEYVEDANAGRFTARMMEELDRRTVLGERLMVGVRSKWGVDLAELGLSPEQVPVLDSLVKEGLLERENLVFRPTPKGFFFADLMGRKLLASIEA
jgi:oxygen-independent coproporphyrinogen-3 oxidase